MNWPTIVQERLSSIIDVDLSLDVEYARQLALYALQVTGNGDAYTHREDSTQQILAIYRKKIKAGRSWREIGCRLPSVWEVQQMLMEDRDSDAYLAAWSVLKGCFDQGSMMLVTHYTMDWRKKSE